MHIPKQHGMWNACMILHYESVLLLLLLVLNGKRRENITMSTGSHCLVSIYMSEELFSS